MSEQLDWLVRNVHVWPEGFAGAYSVHDEVMFLQDGQWPAGYAIHTHQQWLDRRAELQNKPSWADHPDAKCFVQNDKGTWFKNTKSHRVSSNNEGGWRNQDGDGGWRQLETGEVLGDWRDTLEQRPADLSELKSDRYKFEPFTSLEDAQPELSGAQLVGVATS